VNRSRRSAGRAQKYEEYLQSFPHPVRASARSALVTPISTSQQLRNRFFSLYIRLKNNNATNKDNRQLPTLQSLHALRILNKEFKIRVTSS
jgi:hypothetical protein